MIALLISKALLFILAGCSKATADTISPRKSELAKKGKFWDIKQKGKYLPLTKYPVDGWHIFGSIYIISAIVGATIPGYRWYIDIPVEGLIMNISFNIMYYKILK